MLLARQRLVLSLFALFFALIGCSRSQMAALKNQNAALVEQNRTLMARVENLEVHSRHVEDKLMQTEEELALLDERNELGVQQVANYETERNLLHNQVNQLLNESRQISPRVRRQLEAISKRNPHLRFDPNTGISKLDTDILFDIGSTELKPGTEPVLRQLVETLKSNQAADLKILVVGHTDNRQVAQKPARDRFRDNFHLSTERALTVSQCLSNLGLPKQRIGVAGFGPYQPIASNLNSRNRHKNRRVELFVLAPEVPVIGWTETIPTVYY